MSKRRDVLKATGATGLGYMGMSAPAKAFDSEDTTHLGSTVFLQSLVHYEIKNVETNNHIDQISFFIIDQDRDRLHLPVISKEHASLFEDEEGVVATPSLQSTSEKFGIERTTKTLTVQKTAYHKPQITISLDHPIGAPTLGFTHKAGNKVDLETESGKTEVSPGDTTNVQLPSRSIGIADKNRPIDDGGPSRQATPIVTLENHGELDVYATEIRER